MKNHSLRTLFLVSAAAIIPGIATAQVADTVFLNGTIHTMNEKRPTAEAIAI